MSNSWRTELKLNLSPPIIDHGDCLLFLGSCFSEHIAERCFFYGLRAQKNPVGILYNPVSIEHLLDMLIHRKQLDRQAIVRKDSVYVYEGFHGDFFGESPELLMQKWERMVSEFHLFWAKARFLIVTLGSSYVYTRKDTGQIVGNCHKQASGLFERSQLSDSEVSASLQRIQLLCDQAEFPKELILTCSPVRHIKDGIVENSRSKAHLLVGIAQHVDTSRAVYFPSYELMMDDLRDYRYYGDDMLHPTEKAVDYIWEKFSDRFFDQRTKDMNKQVGKIRRQQEHRPFHVESEAHKKFVEKLEESVQNLIKGYPYLAETIMNKS